MSSAGAEWVSAAGDEIDPARGDLSHTLQRHPTGGLRERSATRHGDRNAQRCDVHVVEQHDIRAGLQRLRQLVGRRHFDLDPQCVRSPLPR
jgi:hypothetical protein